MVRIAELLMGTALLAGCAGHGGATGRTAAGLSAGNSVPAFNSDSAYSYIARQVEFGPRVPNTEPHRSCARWLESRLVSSGARTYVQEIEVTAFDGTRIKGFNIIGKYNPQVKKRIMLCSHWDSRPWADNDPDAGNRKKPFDAANDGASGVGVILEIARQLQQKLPEIGVDLAFFDAEDWGPGNDWNGADRTEMWGLGTQYWARHLKEEEKNIRFAVLLDMVGGRDASFCRESFSDHFAPAVVDKVWNAARVAGYGRFFPDRTSGFVTDDHLFINSIAGIPAIDIIPFYPECAESSFGPTWHTVNDNLENIEKSTLQAVGQTLLQVIYSER